MLVKWPKHQVLLLTMVSYVKKLIKINYKWEKISSGRFRRAALTGHLFIFLNMKPLSEVAPGLLVIQILIQAVWKSMAKFYVTSQNWDTVHSYKESWAFCVRIPTFKEVSPKILTSAKKTLSMSTTHYLWSSNTKGS